MDLWAYLLLFFVVFVFLLLFCCCCYWWQWNKNIKLYAISGNIRTTAHIHNKIKINIFSFLLKNIIIFIFGFTNWANIISSWFISCCICGFFFLLILVSVFLFYFILLNYNILQLQKMNQREYINFVLAAIATTTTTS